MKKFLTILLAMLVVVTASMGLTACGNKDAKPMIVSGLVLAEEQYGIAAKKGNDALISKINEALIAIADDELQSAARPYGLNSEIAVTTSTTNPKASASDASWNNLVSRGKVVIGYTIFAPIAYEVKDGEPTKGFDIDLAKAVFAYLNTTYSTNISIEFQEIDWDSKEALLEGGSIDLVWNGLTITAERLENMCISIPYLNNKQVAVIMSNKAKKYTDIDSMKKAIVGAERGSAGESIIESKKIGKEYVAYKSQLDAFTQLKARNVEVIVIDSVMANYYISLEK